MRFPMLRTTIFLILVILFCSSIFFINGKKATAIPIIQENGKVLGVSESKDEQETGNEIKAELPLSGPNQVSPVKKENYQELENIEGRAIIQDENGDILFENDSRETAPVASITKLVTALVFLEKNPGWDNILEIEKGDQVSGGRAYLYVNEKAKIKDIFYLSLVASDNSAAKALVRSTGLAEQEFVELMNSKMKEMGLNDTHFVEPIGLNSNNVSNAYEVAQFAKSAFGNEEIATAALTKKYEFSTASGRKVLIKNTDSLLSTFPEDGINILGGKTGYTIAAGYCFVGDFENEAGNNVISVVLGAKDINSRFTITKKLVEWTYDNFLW